MSIFNNFYILKSAIIDVISIKDFLLTKGLLDI